MALFTVGQRVWFRQAGATPFILGSPTDAHAEAGNELVGRLSPTVTISGAQSGLSDAQGVPTIHPDTLGLDVSSFDAVSGIYLGGTPIGVVSSDSTDPLAPHNVQVVSDFVPPADKALYNPNIDQVGNTGEEANTVLTKPVEVRAPVVATGPAINISGNHPFASSKIDLTGSNRLDARLPSNQQDPGVIVNVYTGVSPSTVSPDGTQVRSGVLYEVLWGVVQRTSNPHASKYYNGVVHFTHAEEDLIPA